VAQGQRMTTGILGGGALGLTLALRLAQRGEAVIVIEREPVAGGLAAGFPLPDPAPEPARAQAGASGPRQQSPFSHPVRTPSHARGGAVGAEPGAATPGTPVFLEKFYHHLFRTDREAIALIDELGLGERLVWKRANTSTLVDGRCYQLDGALPVLRFQPLALHERLRLGAVSLGIKLLPDPHWLERDTAAAWLRRWMGTRAYEIVWGPQLAGKFGPYADQIAMPWFWARLHYRTASLGYLRGGFQQLYEALVAAIRAHAGTVQLGTAVERVTTLSSGRLRIVTEAGNVDCDRVVSTLATRLSFKLIPELPADFRAAYDWGLAYGAHCLILALDRPLLEHVYWLSITDPGYPFLALVEHTNFMPAADYGGRHLLYLGNYLPMDHPLFTRSTAEVVAEFLPHLKRINPRFRAEWVRESWSFAAPFAQPIVTRDFARHIPPHRTPIANLYLANMFQVYPQDRGQNYSIALANRLARELAEERA